MRIKIIKQFLAGTSVVCILYGTIINKAYAKDAFITEPNTTTITNTDIFNDYNRKPHKYNDDDDYYNNFGQENSDDDSTKDKSPTYQENNDDSDENDNETISPDNGKDDESEETKMTLSEYLSKLRCTGCGRRCSLLSPSCSRGRRNAQNATEEYNETYGN